MIRIIVGCLGITVLVAAGIAEEPPVALSLRDACVMAVKNSVDVCNDSLEVEKQVWRRREAAGNLLPQLEGYSSFNYYYAIPKVQLPGEIFGGTGLIPVEFGTTYDWSSGFKATQVLYNRAAFTAFAVARRSVEMAKLSMRQKKEEAVHQVAQVYSLCTATSAQRTLLQQSLLNMERLLDIAHAQAENGIIRSSDCSRIAVGQLTLQSEIDNLSRLLAEQTGMLVYLTGIGAGREVMLTDSLTGDTAETGAVHPPVDRTELRILDMQKNVAALMLRLRRDEHYPSLALFMQHSYQTQRNTPDFFDDVSDNFFRNGLVGVTLSVPLFNGFSTGARIHEAAIELEQARNARGNAQTALTRASEDAGRQFATMLRERARQREAIQLAQQNYEVELEGYRQSVTPLSDLLTAENSVTEARLSYCTALLGLRNAKLDMQRAAGTLLETMINESPCKE